MRYYGYPEKIVKLLENAYKDTFSAVWVNGELSEWFETVMGALHGRVLSPLLVNIFLEMTVVMTLVGSNEGADIGGERLGDMTYCTTRGAGKGIRPTDDAGRSRTSEPNIGMKN